MNITYQFQNKDLLQQALTHKSHGKKNNERLEFLGDSVLDAIIAYHLFCQYPKASEGQLSRMKANLIQKDTLASIAIELDIAPHIICQHPEIAQQATTHANVIEAIIAAIFIDGGIEQCTQQVKIWFKNKIDQSYDALTAKDNKTILQEYCQQQRLDLPNYSTIDITGLEHQQCFHIKCQINGVRQQSTGNGKTIRAAEQMAAKNLIQLIQKESKL